MLQPAVTSQAGHGKSFFVDTLELGSDGHAEYHCVLMYVDVFRKWMEVIPLRRHDAKPVAAGQQALSTAAVI